MAETFGIDLGTTNSSISRLVDGQPVAIPVDGHAILPSVVLFKKDGIVVGREARNLEIEFPERTVRSVKRRMGQDFRYEMDDRVLTPEEVSAQILGALKNGAETATGQSVHDVVITVPAYFDDTQRRATLKAGELAGLNVLRLLNEPTSASLVYDHARSEAAAAPEIVLVYDLGGGTFDVSILEVFEGVREVRATAGNTHLGGDDFDEALVRLFVDELKRTSSADVTADPRAMARLRRVAEATKIKLSADTQTEVQEEFVGQDDRGKPVHLKMLVTRRDFESLIAPLLESTVALCRKAIEDAKLDGQSVDRICLVGGSTRIPKCRALLTEAFHTDIHEEVDPDLAVALGASIQAGLLRGEKIARILVDVASHTLGIRVVGMHDDGYSEPDTFAPVLRRNTVLPVQRTEEFYTMVPNQEQLEVEVFQGEGSRVSQNAPVGSFMFPLVAAPAHSPVKVEFAYDLNGVVKVSVSQPGTDNAKTVALSVADAGKGAQSEGKLTPIERKSEALLARLHGEAKEELGQLLRAYQSAPAAAKQQAEEALLDYFVDCDEHEGDAADRGDEAP